MHGIMEDPGISTAASPAPAPLILVVDDDKSIREMLLNYFQSLAFPFRGASDANDALQIINQENIDLVISDIKMKGINGLELLKQAHQGHPLLPFIIMTGYAPDYVYEDIINLGASDFIAKPFSFGELKAKISRILRERKTLSQLHESLKKIKQVFSNTIVTLASALELRDSFTAGHQRRVADLACAMGQELGLPEARIEILRLAALVHDIGKIGVPTEILVKPGKLGEFELNLIKFHAQMGFDILKPMEFPWPIADMVYQHHERMNGSGYPQGLMGAEICLEARIIGVADVVEAMSAHRPYRPALGLTAALAEIAQNRGNLYDEKVADACTGLFTEKGFKFDH